MQKEVRVISILVLGMAMVPPNPAYAYIDPGTGSMLIQVVIAAVAALSVSIGLFWRRLRNFFARILKREQRGGQGPDDS